MSAIVRARVTFTLDVEVGSFGADWSVASLRKDAQRAVDVAVGHLAIQRVPSCAVISNVSTANLVVFFEDK
jgi:hypothetical protein